MHSFLPLAFLLSFTYKKHSSPLAIQAPHSPHYQHHFNVATTKKFCMTWLPGGDTLLMKVKWEENRTVDYRKSVFIHTYIHTPIDTHNVNLAQISQIHAQHFFLLMPSLAYTHTSVTEWFPCILQHTRNDLCYVLHVCYNTQKVYHWCLRSFGGYELPVSLGIFVKNVGMKYSGGAAYNI